MQKNQQLPSKKHVVIAFFGMFFCSGTLMILISIVMFIVLFPSAYWPSVPGVVTSSQFMERGGEVTPSHTRHYIVIRYDYRISGKKYTGHRLSVIEFMPPNKKAAQRLYEQYHVGASVTVYYYPKNPQKSCLIAGLPGGFYRFLFSGLGVMLFGLICLVCLFRYSSNDSSDIAPTTVHQAIWATKNCDRSE